MRQWVTPRSLMLHLAFVVIASGCLIAGWWQVHRAMAGNTLSYLYSVEWPAFAIVAGIGWWQMFHDTPEDIAERKAYHVRMRAASAAVVARSLPRSALAITVESDELDVSRALGSGERALDASAVRALTDGTDWAGGSSASLPDTALGDTALIEPGELDESDGSEDGMTAYNQYLALLAVRGRPKTWRNPRGLG